MENKIKVIVVDDSALIRKIIADMINKEDDMIVIDKAKDGYDLLEKLKVHNPDIITLDVEMNNMNGIEVLEKLNNDKDLHRVLMVSSLTTKSSSITMECLRLGALDFIPKPSKDTLHLENINEDLIRKIRILSKVKKENIKKIRSINVSKIPVTRNVIVKNTGNIQAIAIGASTGGPKALNEIITKLPNDLGVPIFVVQHMPIGFTKTFAERLDRHSRLRVCEGFDGQVVGRNVVYLAPGGYHMEVTSSKKISLNQKPTKWGVRPAVDNLFESIAKVYGKEVLSVVLTGMGRDGAEGTVAIKREGGTCLSQDKESSLIYGMPKAAYETGVIDEVISLNKVAEVICKIVKG